MTPSQFATRARPVVVALVAASAIGGGVGLVVAALMGVGQAWAIGWSNAWNVYGDYWKLSLMVGVLLGASMYIAVYILEEIGRRMPPLVTNWLPQLLIVGFVGYLIFSMSRGAYRHARGAHPTLAFPASVSEIRSQLGKQSVTITKLSVDAQALLAQLDATAAGNARARAQLLQTVLAVEKQRAAVAETEKMAGALATAQADSVQRLAKLRSLLGGERPITKRDLDIAQRSGLWQGFILGVLSSLVAAVIYRRLPPLPMRADSHLEPKTDDRDDSSSSGAG